MPNKRKGSGFNKLGGLRLQSGRRDQVSIDKVGGPITLKWQTVKNQQYSQVPIMSILSYQCSIFLENQLSLSEEGGTLCIQWKTGRV